MVWLKKFLPGVGFEQGDQAARAQHVEQDAGGRCALYGCASGEIFDQTAFDIDAQAMAGVDEIVNALDFQNRKADLGAIAIKGA